MKMSRSKLKSIVKECLVEILAEGLEGSTSKLNERKNLEARRLNEERALQERRRKLETSIESTVSNLTDDSIMQSILADTARTTLQEQMSHESQGPGMSNGGAPGINLDKIFSESANNWSKLAFSEKKRS